MKSLLSIFSGILAILSVSAQQEKPRISDVEPFQAWYYVYDQEGDRIGAISNQEGDLVGFSENVIILKKFNHYYFYNTTLSRYAQKPVDAIGKITSVSSTGFTAEKNGRRILYDLEGNRK